MIDHATGLGARLRDGLAAVVEENDEVAFALLLALFAGGHVLIEGVPGTAKTLFARTLAALLGAQFRRVQFTPDLMPADLVGTTVFDPATATFSLRHGPVFTELLLADEINRTPPKTQSALLEAMEEGAVTIDGTTHPLPPLFLVCATQNPIEYEGTYPLPEAQLDRFLVRARTAYPRPERERALFANAAAGFDARDLSAVPRLATTGDLLAARAAVRTVRVADAAIAYAYEIVARTRSAEELALGASPRAGIALVRAAQAAATIDGRDFVSPDDIKRAAPLVLGHRLLVRPEAELDGISAENVLARILAAVPVPTTA